MNGNTPDQAKLRDVIGIAMFGPKYYDYCLTPVTTPRGKYPYQRAIDDLDMVVQKVVSLTQQPSHQAIEGWWICTDFLSKGGQKVMGPFVSRDYAFAARTQLEKLNAPVTYWIDSLTAPDETGREA